MKRTESTVRIGGGKGVDPDIRATDAAPGQESAATTSASAAIPAPRRASRSPARKGEPAPFPAPAATASLPTSVPTRTASPTPFSAPSAYTHEPPGTDFPTHMLVRMPAPDEVGADASAPKAAPIFVDATGRRGRLIRRGAIAMLAVVGAYAVAVVLSFLGGPVPPNALLPFPNEPSAAASNPASPTNPNATTSQGSSNATHAGAGANSTSPGNGPLPGPSGAASSSSAASPSVSPSPTASRRTPPGHVGRTASPGSSNGHGH